VVADGLELEGLGPVVLPAAGRAAISDAVSVLIRPEPVVIGRGEPEALHPEARIDRLIRRPSSHGFSLVREGGWHTASAYLQNCLLDQPYTLERRQGSYRGGGGRMTIGKKSESTPLPPELHLDGFIGYNLKRAYILVQEDFRRTVEDEGLTTRTFSALSIVVQLPNITQAEVARMLGVDRSGMVAITDDLQARGYLTRRASTRDRRVQALLPTELGQNVCARTRRKVQDHENRLFAHFSPGEQQLLVGLLRKIRDGKQEETEE